MPTKNVVLTDQQAIFVDILVNSGRYQNASEVLREGLRLIELRDAENAIRMEALRRAVQVGISNIDQGRFTTFESDAALKEHLGTLAAKALADASAAHDTWFRAQVALGVAEADAPDAEWISNDEANASLAAKRAGWAKRAKGGVD